jgi:predicted metal-binding protein
MSKASPPLARPRFDTALLVCKSCGKRSDAPRKFKPKEVAVLARRASRHLDERVRVLMTTCLGLCPKAAIAVARVASGAPTRIVAIESRRQIEAAVVLMSARS